MNAFSLPLATAAHNIELARNFCDEFLNGVRSKYIFGRNIYTDSLLANDLKIDGVIDDFTSDTIYRGYPVVRSESVASDAMVLIASGVRPLTARRKIRAAGNQTLDFFAFRKHSGLQLVEVANNISFEDDFVANRDKYEWIDKVFEDDESRAVFRKLINFRLSCDLDFMEGFVTDVDGQYFEEFLNLRPDGETFVDAGGFDGATSLEFIKRSPNYRAVHVFEPETENYINCQATLKGYDRVQFHKAGLSNAKGVVSFAKDGSSSRIDVSGEIAIAVDRLDDMLDEPITFIKMDIEGAEQSAIEGAAKSIAKYTPRIAACVYHLPGDFWRIPEKVLAINGNYRVRLRHYSEAVNESVMFFLPR